MGEFLGSRQVRGDHRGGAVEAQVTVCLRPCLLLGPPLLEQASGEQVLPDLAVQGDDVGEKAGCQVGFELGEPVQDVDAVALPVGLTTGPDQRVEVFLDPFVAAGAGVGQRRLQQVDHHVVALVDGVFERVVQVQRVEEVVRKHPPILPAARVASTRGSTGSTAPAVGGRGGCTAGGGG